MCNCSVQKYIYVGGYNSNSFEKSDLWYEYVPMTRERKKEKNTSTVWYGQRYDQWVVGNC